MFPRPANTIENGMPAEILARLMAHDSDDSEYQKDVQQQRDYYHGKQFVQLNDRLRQFLGGDVSLVTQDYKRIRLNIYRTVINAVVERLIVSAMSTDEQGQTEPLKDEFGNVIKDANGKPQAGIVKPIANWAWKTWQRNRMDARQRRFY